MIDIAKQGLLYDANVHIAKIAFSRSACNLILYGTLLVDSIGDLLQIQLCSVDLTCTWLFDKHMAGISVWLCCVIVWGLYCRGTFEGQARAALANVSTHIFVRFIYHTT